MTETQWLASENPAELLDWLKGSNPLREHCPIAVSERKFRLWVEACREQMNDLGTQWANVMGTPADLARAAHDVATPASSRAWPRCPVATRAALLREVVGNVFRPVTLSDACRTPQVLSLAQAAYDERPGRKCRCLSESRAGGFVPKYPDCPDCRGAGTIDDGALDPLTLLALADALEEANCDCVDLLQHLRSPGPHVRGCHAIDLILNLG